MIRPLLLHLANSGSPSRELYALKARLLRRHGKLIGHDVQEIVKPCYGSRGGEYGDFEGCTKNASCRCGGTGVFARRIIGLEKWRWGRFVFHIPMEYGSLPGALITIRGRVQHRNYGRLSSEAGMWLFILSGEFKSFWREFRGCVSYGFYPWPLKWAQRILVPVIWKFRSHNCIYCGRWFISGGTGWCVCRACRSKPEAVEDIPF